MSSIACQKDYTLVVSSGGGPPNGPIQLDAATVAQLNIYAKFFGGAGNFTGLLPNVSGGNWFEPQSDAPAYGLSISRSRSPSLYFVIIPPPASPDAIVLISDTIAGTSPIGVWSNIDHFPPGGFSPTNPAGWPGPATITVTWA